MMSFQINTPCMMCDQPTSCGKNTFKNNFKMFIYFFKVFFMEYALFV